MPRRNRKDCRGIDTVIGIVYSTGPHHTLWGKTCTPRRIFASLVSSLTYLNSSDHLSSGSGVMKGKGTLARLLFLSLLFPVNGFLRQRPAADSTQRWLHQVGDYTAVPSTDSYVLKYVDDKVLKENRHARQSIFERISHRHGEDCKAALALAVEAESKPSQVPPYEWVMANGEYPLAIQSTEPLLDPSSVYTIRSAADELWSTAEGRKSRFTYQRLGNYEAHVSDLSEKAKEVVNCCLENSIYPLVRDAFHPENNSGNLCVYDSLVIRYNATEAATSTSFTGAGQPLHRDLGIVSVNIMLNDPVEFDGGGTFFENQLRGSAQEIVQPLKPKGPGHCIAHYSSERHAGSATLEGVRDILVLFITDNHLPRPPLLVSNAMLKQCRATCNEQHDTPTEALLCRILHQRLAVEACPSDGEAWQYLGVALSEYSDVLVDSDTIVHVLDAAKRSLEHARRLSPCDSRVYNSLALVLGQIIQRGTSTMIKDDLECAVEEAYEKGWAILERSEKAGCDVSQDFDSLCLNWGLHVSNQDRFEEACRILFRAAQRKEIVSEQKQQAGKVLDDAFTLFSFCMRQFELERGE